MIISLPPQSPFRQQLIPPITTGLSSSEAASALHLHRKTIWQARASNTYSPDNLLPPSTPSILSTKYPINTKRPRKLMEKHIATKWLKDNLPVKSGSKYETYVQHDTNYKLYNDYQNHMKEHNMGTLYDDMLNIYGDGCICIRHDKYIYIHIHLYVM